MLILLIFYQPFMWFFIELHEINSFYFKKHDILACKNWRCLERRSLNAPRK